MVQIVNEVQEVRAPGVVRVVQVVQAVQVVQVVQVVRVVLGRHTWQILNDSRQCEDGSNYSHSLSLSSCAEQQFSCDDGSCVDMTLREAFNIFS